jgi:hypothetical protein
MRRDAARRAAARATARLASHVVDAPRRALVMRFTSRRAALAAACGSRISAGCPLLRHRREARGATALADAFTVIGAHCAAERCPSSTPVGSAASDGALAGASRAKARRRRRPQRTESARVCGLRCGAPERTRCDGRASRGDGPQANAARGRLPRVSRGSASVTVPAIATAHGRRVGCLAGWRDARDSRGSALSRVIAIGTVRRCGRQHAGACVQCSREKLLVSVLSAPPARRAAHGARERARGADPTPARASRLLQCKIAMLPPHAEPTRSSRPDSRRCARCRLRLGL